MITLLYEVEIIMNDTLNLIPLFPLIVKRGLGDSEEISNSKYVKPCLRKVEIRNRRHWKLAVGICFIGVLLVLSGCAQDEVPVAVSIGTTTNETLEVNGVTRSYMLHLPPQLQPNAPLVFVLHGYGSNPADISNYTRMSVLAAEYGFGVCYPAALTGSDGASWNVGYSNFGVDDIGFITALAAELQETHGFSPQNTFCAGMSNGGDMTLQLAYFKPDLFKAIAPVTGTLMNWIPDSVDLERIVPTLMINGTDDNITFWDGDENYEAIGIDGYMGTRATIDLFVEMNGCTESNRTNLPDVNRDDGSTVIIEKNISCEGNRQVWLYKVVDGGHDWPGASGNKDFNASEEIWLFFEQFVE